MGNPRLTPAQRRLRATSQPVREREYTGIETPQEAETRLRHWKEGWYFRWGLMRGEERPFESMVAARAAWEGRRLEVWAEHAPRWNRLPWGARAFDRLTDTCRSRLYECKWWRQGAFRAEHYQDALGRLEDDRFALTAFAKQAGDDVALIAGEWSKRLDGHAQVAAWLHETEGGAVFQWYWSALQGLL